VHPEALRHWLGQDDAGRRPSGERVAGSESEKDARIGELVRANSILKAASAFFAKEMDPPPPKW
jgi:transposase